MFTLFHPQILKKNQEIKYADFTENYKNGLLDLLRGFTEQPPQHFTQAYAETENSSPEANINNDKAADLILEACRTEDRTSKFKIFDKAESMLTKILSREPRFGQARQNLGTIQLERGIVLNDEKIIQESINIFTQALKNLRYYAQIAICNYSIGKAYARLGNLKDNNDERLKLYKQAIPFLMKAIKEDKKLHFAYYWLAKVYHETYKVTQHESDYRNAKEYFTEAVLLNPSYMDSLGEMEALNRSPEKIAALRRWVGLQPTRSSGSISTLWKSILSKIKSKAESKRRVEAEAWLRHIQIDRNPRIDRRDE
jgi:tetratricopeptide (TPR) repeat protein